jgi:hypothetical protein
MDITRPSQAVPGASVRIRITVANTGSGHNFPTGFPEGRTSWLAVHAVDLASGKELPIFALPLVTTAGGQTTTLADNFSIIFPIGITIKGNGCGAFDMEFDPSIQDSPRQVSLTLQPGGVWRLGHWFAVGIRAAFVANSSEFGFTPLLNKSWPIKSDNGFFKAYFVEADLPVRFNRPPGGPATDPVTFAMHFGLGF